MSDKKETLKNLILNHPNLSTEDKEELAGRVEGLSAEQLEYILPLVEEAPENLVKISEYYKEKKEILASDDPQKASALLVEHYKKLWERAQQPE
jgi:RNA polymerase-interacting CarD/CdnL/TRCF family regulator